MMELRLGDERPGGLATYQEQTVGSAQPGVKSSEVKRETSQKAKRRSRREGRGVLPMFGQCIHRHLSEQYTPPPDVIGKYLCRLLRWLGVSQSSSGCSPNSLPDGEEWPQGRHL
jgi:hypothetical protein